MERFGRYVLLEVIAKGGMGEVWRAAQVGSAGFAKPLAIKRVLPHLAEDPDFVNMLIDEAKISAALTHPNILQVLDLGRINKTYYIAMEFLAGQPLNRVVAAALRQGEKLPASFCAAVILGGLQGLRFAHEKTDASGKQVGIIHRDISPQNLILTYQGEVKLADFGIAKATQRAGAETTGGKLKGKPSYMAPEQINEGIVDQRMDLYAMGVVLHEILCMKRMRRGDTDMQLLMEVSKGEFPRFEDMGVNVPGPLAQVVYRALEPDPAHRWQTAGDFADNLMAAVKVAALDAGTHQIGALMRRLFPQDMEKEKEAAGRFSAIIDQMAAADSDEVSKLVDKYNTGQTQHGEDFFDVTKDTNVPATRWRLMLAGLGVVMVAAAGGTYLWLNPTPDPAVAAQGGTLVVDTQPPGALISINGKALPKPSPTVAYHLPVGLVELEAVLSGYLNTKRVVTVEAGAPTHVKLQLAVRNLDVMVHSTPPGADVSMDGQVVGKTPVTVKFTGNRPVHLGVSLPGYATEGKVLTAENAPLQLTFALDLEEEPKKPPREEVSGQVGGGKGVLTVQSDPWSRVYIDGKDTGRFTPLAAFPLSAGRHKVKLINQESDVKAEFVVLIKAGSALSVSKELR